MDVLQNCKFEASTIPAYRKSPQSLMDWELNGVWPDSKTSNMLKNPVVGHEADQERFRDINQFLRISLGKPEANIDIPHSVDDLYVEFDRPPICQLSLRYGIHQAILAIAVTLIENAVVCIEEPGNILAPRTSKEIY